MKNRGTTEDQGPPSTAAGAVRAAEYGRFPGGTAAVRGAWLVCLVAAAAALVGAAVLMTGPAPAPAGGGASEQAPPLVLRDTEPPGSPLRSAASALAQGDHRSAQQRFTRLVAESPDQVEPQVGLVLSRWRALGPQAVIRDLEQLVREYPGDAYVTVHLGLAQMLSGRPREAVGSLRRARGEGWTAAAALDIARRADDLLHPAIAPGYPPLLLRTSDVPPRNRAQIQALRSTLLAGDRPRAREQAQALERPTAGRPGEALVQVAVQMAMFEKDDPSRTTATLNALARRHPEAAAAADLHRALVYLWTGDRKAGLRLLARLASTPDRTRWHRQAAALAHRLER